MRWPWWAWILLVLPWGIILSMLGYVVWTFWPRPEPPKPAVTVPHQWWCGGKTPCACSPGWKREHAVPKDVYQKLLKLKEKGKR